MFLPLLNRCKVCSFKYYLKSKINFMAENEKSTREQLEEIRLLKEKQRLQQENVEYQQQTYEKAESAKQKTEFSRYKQDCRKRALDVAMAEVERSGETFTNERVTKAAEKYYNWLISIPQ